MVNHAMAAVVKTLLEQVAENEGLRSLLVSSEHEDQRPVIKIDHTDFTVGLVDDKPMLLRLRDRELVNPELLGTGKVTEITWKLRS